jgi:hypothetical protein
MERLCTVREQKSESVVSIQRKLKIRDYEYPYNTRVKFYFKEVAV